MKRVRHGVWINVYQDMKAHSLSFPWLFPLHAIILKLKKKIIKYLHWRCDMAEKNQFHSKSGWSTDQYCIFQNKLPEKEQIFLPFHWSVPCHCHQFYSDVSCLLFVLFATAAGASYYPLIFSGTWPSPNATSDKNYPSKTHVWLWVCLGKINYSGYFGGL